MSDSAIIAVCTSPRHGFSKQSQPAIRLLAGLGIEGDAHCGATVQHLYLKRRTPLAPNLMQVHLIQSELIDELNVAGYAIQPGELGENITTRNIDLLHLPVGTRLHLGNEAVIELTCLRNPCKKIEDFRSGLLKQVITRDAANKVVPKAGVMGIVLTSGDLHPGAPIRIHLPPQPHYPLQML